MDMFEQLLTSSPTNGVSPELLEMAGRKAAQAFLEQGVPLNEAVRGVVGDNPNFGNEHIKRVIEFANNTAFQHLFEKSEDKNIHFDVADPGVILRDLKDGGSPAHDGKTMSSDYTASPKMEKDEFADPESGLQSIFQGDSTSGSQHQGEPVEKNAGGMGDGAEMPKMAMNTGHANPVEDVYDFHAQMIRSRGEMAQALNEWDSLLKTASADFYESVKKEVLDAYGAGLGSVTAALSKYASKTMVAAALDPVVEKLVTDRAAPAEDLNRSITKVAGVVVNPRHPIITAFTGLMKAAERKIQTEEAIKELDKGLAKTAAFLKDAGKLVAAVSPDQPKTITEFHEKGHGW